MSSEEILDGNILIHKFMGWNIEDVYNSVINGKIHILRSENKRAYTTINELSFTRHCYHSSWDWLMPVVEKIEKIIWNKIDLTEEVIINGLSCRMPIKDDAFISIKNTKIEATYDCVVEFIKWHNNQKLTNETN